MPINAAMSASANGTRTYQRGLSKQMMNVNRYSASGSTQKNGITATSWHILFVVASSSTEAQAGSSSQRSLLRVEGCELRVEVSIGEENESDAAGDSEEPTPDPSKEGNG